MVAAPQSARSAAAGPSAGCQGLLGRGPIGQACRSVPPARLRWARPAGRSGHCRRRDATRRPAAPTPPRAATGSAPDGPSPPGRPLSRAGQRKGRARRGAWTARAPGRPGAAGQQFRLAGPGGAQERQAQDQGVGGVGGDRAASVSPTSSASSSTMPRKLPSKPLRSVAHAGGDQLGQPYLLVHRRGSPAGSWCLSDGWVDFWRREWKLATMSLHRDGASPSSSCPISLWTGPPNRQTSWTDTWIGPPADGQEPYGRAGPVVEAGDGLFQRRKPSRITVHRSVISKIPCRPRSARPLWAATIGKI